VSRTSLFRGFYALSLASALVAAAPAADAQGPVTDAAAEAPSAAVPASPTPAPPPGAPTAPPSATTERPVRGPAVRERGGRRSRAGSTASGVLMLVILIGFMGYYVVKKLRR
jgi:hypothetical protein